MRFYRRRHDLPELNTTSTADISFMLLIFFLVTTSMETDKGLPRQLPPYSEQPQQETVVKQGTLLTIDLTADNTILIDGRPMIGKVLVDTIVTFIRQTGEQHVILVKTDKHAAYDTYFQVQNALATAYRKVRNTAARQRFGKAFELLTPPQKEQIVKQYPQRIAEQYTTAKTALKAHDAQGGHP